jgi:SAM-dependent methyltransferase
MNEKGHVVDVALCTFGILALELALIRWTGSQVRIVAYFANLVLIAAFLGMGLGVVLGRRRPALVHAALPALAVLCAVLAFAEPLRLMHMSFPDPTIYLWEGDARFSTILTFLGTATVIVAMFWAITAVVALAATPLGPLFDRLPPLRAYTADVAGSIAGIIAFTLLSSTDSPPWQWLALGALPVLRFSRKATSLVSAGMVVALAWYSGRGALFSPYNRIDLQPASAAFRATSPLRRDWVLSVNRDYHQRIWNYSAERVNIDIAQGDSVSWKTKTVYELPFRLRPEGASALVVGAGTGNDVAAALRVGYPSVTAVEIDPEILDLGRWLHPEDPYADARVHPVNDDARAFFTRHPDQQFDVVAYGLLDSHGMFSAMSSLRLDNYVYTVEGIRDGWLHVRDGGVLAISFSTRGGTWLADRIIRTIREATGHVPVIVRDGDVLDYGTSFVVAKGTLDDSALPPDFRAMLMRPTVDESVRVPTDDWPFLYIRPRSFPVGYLTVLFLIGITAVLSIRKSFQSSRVGAEPGTFDWPMFLMGAGFMLLETRMVTALSLLFGSTWIVNAFVFGGVLVMVLLANLWVIRRPPASIGRWFVPLIASVLLTTLAVRAGTLSGFDASIRGLMGGLLFALPIAFAGVIVASLLQRSAAPPLSLGANLMGAVLGGILEYTSMFFGLTFVGILSLVCYVAAYLSSRARSSLPPQGRQQRGACFFRKKQLPRFARDDTYAGIAAAPSVVSVSGTSHSLPHLRHFRKFPRAFVNFISAPT